MLGDKVAKIGAASGLDGGNINASFDDGILSIEIPKIEPKLPKKHTVKIA